MNNAILLGTYTALEAAVKAGLPVTDGNAIWQAWQLADNEVMMQPVDAQGLPSGVLFVINPAELQMYFSVIPGTVPELRDTPALHANAPDLLSFWYEQVISNKGTSAPSPQPQPAASQVPESKDELLNALWEDLHAAEEEAMQEESSSERSRKTQSVQQSAKLSPTVPPLNVVGGGNVPVGMIFPEQNRGSSLPEFSTQPAMPEPSLTRRKPETVPGVSASETFRPASIPPDNRMPVASTDMSAVPDARQPIQKPSPLDLSPEEEASAGIIELAMRKEFNFLVNEMRTVGRTPEVIKKLERLLMRPARFGWKQKFMFSEFGLTLRREKLPLLALMSHKRALEVSPEDEHVLFNMARTVYELGKVDEAKKYLERALAVVPQFAAAGNFLAFLSSPGDPLQ